MGRKRRKLSDDINLTPLLDVLFVILFVVMLSGFSGNIASREQLDEKQNENMELQDQIAELEEKLDVSNDTNETYRIYEDQAVIITMENRIEKGTHVIKLYKGTEHEELPSIQMGENRANYIKRALKERFMEQIEEAGDKPVFVVFYRDNDKIYRKEENVPIEDAFRELSEEKQFFSEIKEQ